MNILSWNVNGIRAVERKEALKPFFALDGDIMCIQETKAHPEQLSKALQKPEGYYAYFSSPHEKKGYSGVAIYTKKEPDEVRDGIGISRFDNEGRILEIRFGDLLVINVYFPNGGMGPERLQYKLDFYDAFLSYLRKRRKEGKKIIFCGDVNTAHEEIDLARPKQNEANTGFLPEERAWIDEVISAGFVDVFRHFYPNREGAYTYWDMKTRARDRNVGWRIDYFFVSSDLISRVENIQILSDIMGSDHCPITMTLEEKKD